jgi:hypothetical protein
VTSDSSPPAEPGADSPSASPGDVRSAIAAVARSYFSKRGTESGATAFGFQPDDLVLAQLMRLAESSPVGLEGLREAVLALERDPAFADIVEVDGLELPMVCHPGGGGRLMPLTVVLGLLSKARVRLFLRGEPADEAVFIRFVLEGLSELARALSDGVAPIDDVSGFCGVSLDAGIEVATPWGTAICAPSAPRSPLARPRPIATVLLAARDEFPVVFDRSPSPEHMFDRSFRSPAGAMLFPLACALAVDNELVAPALMWSTQFLSFDSGNGWAGPVRGLSTTLTAPNVSRHADRISEWSYRVAEAHRATVDIALRRTLSAINTRDDPADSLVDAVTAWENIVGVRSENRFRVTGALVKLIESEPGRRRTAHKRLKAIYDLRSTVVHGGVAPYEKLRDTATEATTIAVSALRASYLRGGDWLALTSEERADRLLLEEP